MGIVAGILSAVVGLATGVMQASAMKKAAKAQKRAQQIQTNKENNNRIAEIKKNIRDRRLRMAKMEQMADAQGVSGSSGEQGAQSASASNLNSNIGRSSGNQVANVEISKYNQKAADYQSRANTIGAIGGAFQGLFSAFA